MDATSRLNRGQNPLRRLGAEYDPKSHQNRMEMNRPPLPTHVCPIVGNIKTYQLNRYLRHTPRQPIMSVCKPSARSICGPHPERKTTPSPKKRAFFFAASSPVKNLSGS